MSGTPATICSMAEAALRIRSIHVHLKPWSRIFSSGMIEKQSVLLAGEVGVLPLLHGGFFARQASVIRRSEISGISVGRRRYLFLLGFGALAHPLVVLGERFANGSFLRSPVMPQLRARPTFPAQLVPP